MVLPVVNTSSTRRMVLSLASPAKENASLTFDNRASRLSRA